MKKILFFLFFCLMFFSFLILPPAASAEDTIESTIAAHNLPASCTDIFATIKRINSTASGSLTGEWEIFKEAECIVWGVISFLLIMGVIVAAFFIVLGGINYMLAGGNSNKQQAAMKTLNSAVIGFALLLASWSIYGFILKFIEYSSYVNQGLVQ